MVFGTLSGGWLIVGDRPTQGTIRSGPTVGKSRFGTPKLVHHLSIYNFRVSFIEGLTLSFAVHSISFIRH